MGWLLQVTRFTVKEARRAVIRRGYHEKQGGVREEEGSPVGAAEQAELAGLLDAALLGLGGVDREAVVRRYLRGESIREVAGALGMTENSAGRRIARALEKLRQLVETAGVSAPLGVVTGVLEKQALVRTPAEIVAGALHVAAKSPAMGLAHSVLAKMAWRSVQQVVVVGVLAVFAACGGVGVGSWMFRGGAAPQEVSGPISAPAATASAASTQPMLTVTSVLEPPSDKLLQEVLAGIETNRGKLKTLHVEAVVRSEDWDARQQQWVYGGELEGQGWIETDEPRRVRIEVSLMRSVWTHGASPFFEQSFTEVWDGARLRRLYGPPHSGVRGDVDTERKLMGEWLLGGRFSLQLQGDAHYFDGPFFEAAPFGSRDVCC